MEYMEMIISFVGLMFFVCFVIIFFIHRALVSSTEGAVKRLNEEIAKANAKQVELGNKIKKADEELSKRQAEARELANKMRSDAEQASKEEREKIIAKARTEGEEIIAKAQNAKETIRREIQKEMDAKAVNYSIKILNEILTQKAKGILNDVLVNEVLDNLKNTDMSRISLDIQTVDVITLSGLDEKVKLQLSSLLKEKLGRSISLNVSTEPQLGGGIILKFGSMTLDGSIKNLIREKGIALQEQLQQV